MLRDRGVGRRRALPQRMVPGAAGVEASAALKLTSLRSCGRVVEVRVGQVPGEPASPLRQTVMAIRPATGCWRCVVVSSFVLVRTSAMAAIDVLAGRAEDDPFL